MKELGLDKVNLERKEGASTARTVLDLRKSALIDSGFVQLNGARLQFDAASRIENTKFESSDISGSTFSGAQIKDSTFQNATIFNANFSGATLTWVNLSRAKLPSASFSGATLTDVNLSEAEIDGANFKETKIDGKTVLAGTTWWLASGWTAIQVDDLAKRFSHTQYRDSQGYRAGKEARETRVEKAREKVKADEKADDATKKASKDELASALNAFAWYRVIRGADLTGAEADIKEALGIALTNGEFADTLAYVLLQRGRHSEARLVFEQSVKVNCSSKDEGLSEDQYRQSVYRYGVTLEYIGAAEEAKKCFERSTELKYEPTHELLLTPRRKAAANTETPTSPS